MLFSSWLPCHHSVQVEHQCALRRKSGTVQVACACMIGGHHLYDHTIATNHTKPPCPMLFVIKKRPYYTILYIYIYTSIHNNSTRRPIDRQQIKLQGFKEKRRRYDVGENQLSLSDICIVGFNFWNQKDQLKFELPSIGSGSVLSSLVQ